MPSFPDVPGTAGDLELLGRFTLSPWNAAALHSILGSVILAGSSRLTLRAALARDSRVHAVKVFMPNTVLALVLSAYICLANGPAGAQEPMVSVIPRETRQPRSSPPRPDLKVDSEMVLVPLTVTDSTDHPVTDLAAGAFRVFEDNVEQKVVSFHREDGPVSVGFVFDASSSMKGRMAPSFAAIRQFLKTSAEGDEFFLICFSDRPTLVTPFTKDSEEILRALSFIQPQGWTALNDAIYLGGQRARKAKNPRRALFILTDGGDNNSRYTESEVRKLVRESDVRIYAIGLFERPQFLERLAMDTGGSAVWAHRLQDLPDLVEKLSRDFRNQYILGYSPAERQKDGKYHTVRVEIVNAIKLMPLNLFWRHGYFAPGQ